MADATAHLDALASAYDGAVAEIERAAQSAHAQIDGDRAALQQLAGSADTRSPLMPNVPIDEPPPAVPPPFDDAPLWQS